MWTPEPLSREQIEAKANELLVQPLFDRVGKDHLIRKGLRFEELYTLVICTMLWRAAARVVFPGQGAIGACVVRLADAGLAPEQIDYVNAHGTSTPLGDKAEVAAVMDVFGNHARKSAGGRLMMSSTKSMTGHCLGASGAVELIACIHAVREGVVAPTINLDTPDDGFDLDLVPHHARERPVRYAMNNTFGFGGHNVTLIVGRYEG